MDHFVRTSLATAVLVFIFLSCNLQAANTDPNPNWPLCGRITENPPVGWVEADGCPSDRFGNPAYSDAPFSSTFGPRPLFSESNRYDFHRGVDIATPIGTPIFAIADGVVQNAGPHPSYSDPMISVRHFRPGETSCNAGGCYHSLNLHVSGWVVSEDDPVVKGQLLGYTGESGSGFDHLHFEVRDAPDFDPFSAWQRDAIHPFEVLPYAVPNNTSIVFNNVDFSNPSAGIVDVRVTSNRFDLVSVDVDLLDASQLPIAQPGDTPNANGYYVEPSSYDMPTWNFQYSHKNSTNFPWSSFGAGGANECPYHADHGPSYSAHVHLDQQYPGNSLEGQFNGVHVRTQKYWPSDVDDYEVELEFLALQGNPSCVQVTATFASGDSEMAEWGTCGAVSPAQLLRGPYLQMQTDDGIAIKWRTDVATDSVVRYGTSPGNLNLSATVGGARTDHEVTLTGLGANQQFWYSVGDSVSAIAGDATYHFSTAPTQGSPADTRIWVIGDSGTANQDARDVRDAFKTYTASDPADIWLMLGDNAYNDGTDAEYQAAVFDTYPEILRQLPLWSTLGNHDGHTADSGTQTGPYYDIFSLPANGEIGGLSSGTEAYYSFDYANIHFVCLDSYDTDRSTSGAMLTWLESDLATNTQPWVIAFWHHPPYTKGSHDSDTEGRLIDMRQNALPILEAWGVDLVMTGHSHSFERSYLLDGHYGASGTLNPVTHVLDPGDGWDLGDGAYEKPDNVAAANAGAVYAVAGSSGKTSSG
ncbi:MAG: peptidoglycan DD-metalloendopeptidase family protein, partial [Xanthomonadales bacterium]|nr:peptidoglycan DD-metalloendopeptidase family protein [Xanthomonadales bacterium]